MRLGFYHWDNSSVFDPYGGNSNVPDFSGLTPTLAQQFVLSNTKTFGTANVKELPGPDTWVTL